MNDSSDGVIGAAEAIADGTRIDWDELASEASTPTADLVRELRVIAELAAVHRQIMAAPMASASLGTDPLAAVPRARSAPEDGVPWGPLLVVESIGSGSFGTVYRAWDPSLDHEVALKRFPAPASGISPQAARIVREGQLLARVRHPNVITVHGACEFEGEAGIWMEFVHGKTLEQIVRDSGPTSAQEATIIGESLCGALAAVHQAGLIHRDVKPSNVMRESGGRIVMLDFGTGMEIEVDGATGVRRAAGTPLYMAPEILEGAKATVQSDIYSLGVLLFFLVTGRYPIEGRSLAEIRAAHHAGRRKLLADLRSDLPAGFVRVVERAIAPLPGDRYPTTGAMVGDLTRAATDDSRLVRAVRNVAAVALFGSVGVWIVGILTSSAYNIALGRDGAFAREPVSAYWLWGFRSLIGPAMTIVVALMVAVAARLIALMLWTLVGSAATRLDIVQTLRRALAGARHTFEAATPRTLAHSVIAAQVVVIGFLMWRFSEIVDVLNVTVANVNPDIVALFRERGWKRVLFLATPSLLALIMSWGWGAVFARERTSGKRAPRVLAALGIVAIVLMVAVLYIAPYRLIYQSRLERVVFANERCYIAGVQADAVLLFCPDSPAPRSRVVPVNDQRLTRSGVVESIFTPASPPR